MPFNFALKYPKKQIPTYNAMWNYYFAIASLLDVPAIAFDEKGLASSDASSHQI